MEYWENYYECPNVTYNKAEVVHAYRSDNCLYIIFEVTETEYITPDLKFRCSKNGFKRIKSESDRYKVDDYIKQNKCTPKYSHGAYVLLYDYKNDKYPSCGGTDIYIMIWHGIAYKQGGDNLMKIKPTRLSGKNLILSAIKSLEEETGFHFIDIEFGDTYFLFGGKKDSICHFHIKEIPKFKFAFWNTNRFDTIQYELENDLQLWSDYYKISSKSELVFFTQFERDIDKFKPSYSGFVQGIYRNAWKETDDNGKSIKQEEWNLSNIPDILKFMHKHPLKAYTYCGCKEAIWNEVSNFSVLKEYIDNSIYYYKRKIKNKLKVNHYIRVSKRFAKRLKTMNYLIVERVNCYPEIEIRITTKPDINIEDYGRDVNIIEEFEDKYFNKISLECWYAVNKDDTISPLSAKEKREDMSLKKMFYNYYNTLVKVGAGNYKKTLEDLWVKRIIITNIEEEKV